MNDNRTTFTRLYRRAYSELEQGSKEEARRIAQSALDLQPDSAETHNLLGTIHLKLEGTEGKAEKYFEHALKFDPLNPHVYNNLGYIAWQRGDLDRAGKLFTRAIELAPRISRSYSNLARVLIDQKRIEAAIDVYRIGLEKKPRSKTTRLKLASLLESSGLYHDALTLYDEIIQIRPDHPVARYNRALLLLKQGHYKQGWRDFEWRFATGQIKYPGVISQQIPEWSEEPLAGKTLLINQEQGFGDAIQMIRYVPLLVKRGAKVLVRCRPRLDTLIKSVSGVSSTQNLFEPLDPTAMGIDYQMPMMSLPRLFDTRTDSIPLNVPYLHVDPVRQDYWKQRVGTGTFNVGLTWSGKSTQANNAQRSCALSDFAPLASIPNVRFFCLQKADQQEQAKMPPAGMEFIDFMPEMEDFSETAALMKCLDLVITVDTSIAHLAGALGHPVWTILWVRHCWRYSMDRSISPWYPTMRLFRQETEGDWSRVMQSVVVSLRETVGSSRTPDTKNKLPLRHKLRIS